jgi:hypothetical protein
MTHLLQNVYFRKSISMIRIFQSVAGQGRPWRQCFQSLVAVAAMALAGTAAALPTTVAVTSNLNPSVFGQPVTLTGTVTCGALMPTGTASFFDGVVLMGVVPLSGGTATVLTSSFSVGAHSITIIYNGDINCDPAAGGTVQNVLQVASTTTLTSLPNPSLPGATVVLNATVTAVPPGGGTPSGTVNFFDGATLLGSAPLDGSGLASFSVSSLTTGSHAITAVYSGAPNFQTSTSAPLTQVVAAAPAPAAVPTLGEMGQFLLAALLAGWAVRSRRYGKQQG